MKIMIAGASGGIGNYLTKGFDTENNILFLTYNKSKDNLYEVKNARSFSYKCDRCKHMCTKMDDDQYDGWDCWHPCQELDEDK